MISFAIRALGFVAGAGLIGIVIFLGFRANSDSDLYIWFAVTAPILPSTGLAVIAFALGAGERQILTQLSKISEIDALIQRANTEEERIALLKQQHDNMEAAVRVEAYRQTLKARRLVLETDGSRVLQELEHIESELDAIGVGVSDNPAAQQAQFLRERLDARERGDLIFRFGKRQYVLTGGVFGFLPFGTIILSTLRLIGRITKPSRGGR